jgi:predicted MFS family arabinose efflux permease
VLQACIPEDYRGRVFALTSGMAVVAIPASALLGGWLADLFGPAPLFAVAGIWILGTALVAWMYRPIRTACL